MSRYTDAYLIARTVTAFGATVKVIALAIGAGIVFLALVVSSRSIQYAVGGIVLAAIVTIPIYILGILLTLDFQAVRLYLQ